jgi:phosphate transport system substrate-binding protein
MRFKGFNALALAITMCFTVSPVWGGNIVIKGSTTVLPVAQKLAEVYMKVNPGIKISLSGGGSGNGIKALIDGSTDIATSSRFIKNKEIKLAVEKGRYPVPFAVAYDCIVPVVHPGNPLSNLTLEQLRTIYIGKIKNWKDMGGPDRKVVVISRDTSSGTYEVWHKVVMNKQRVFPGALLQASNGAIVQAVANNKNAIGYIGIGYMHKSVKPLSVDGIVGSEETTLNGSYPISRPLYMFTAGWPEEDVLNFINFAVHPQKGQSYVRKAGYVPLY